jgi:hypothetical protein
MYEVSGELIVLLITIWSLQKLRKDWQYLNKLHRTMMGKDFATGINVISSLGKRIRLRFQTVLQIWRT